MSYASCESATRECSGDNVFLVRRDELPSRRAMSKD